MAKGKIAIGLLIVSLVLLIIYGLDVVVASSNPNLASSLTGNSAAKGFLPFSEVIRGGALGGGAVILSVAAFAIARNELSSSVSVLLFVNGGLIVAGMLTLIAQGALSKSSSSGILGTVVSTIGLGAALIGLGIWKNALNKRVISKTSQ